MARDRLAQRPPGDQDQARTAAAGAHDEMLAAAQHREFMRRQRARVLAVPIVAAPSNT